MNRSSIKQHLFLLLLACGTGLLWIYNSYRAELVIEYNQPVRLQINENTPYQSSRFVTRIPVTSDSIPDLILSKETPGYPRSISIANCGVLVHIFPNRDIDNELLIWDLENQTIRTKPLGTEYVLDQPLSVIEFDNIPNSLLANPLKDFLTASILSFFTLLSTRILFILLGRRFRALTFR